MKPLFFKLTLFFTFISNVMFGQNVLEYNFKIGDTFHIQQRANQDIIQDMNGSKHEMNNLLEGDITFIIAAVNDSSYIINFAFNRFKLVTTSNLYGTLMNVDTSKEILESDIEGKIFSGLINSPLEMKMLKTGQILSVKGTEEMIASMVDKANIEEEFTKQLMIEAMKKEFGSKSLSKSFEQMTYIYSTNSVSVGDSWNNTYTGDLLCDNTWTLNDDTKVLDISCESIIEMNTNEDSHTMTLTGAQNTAVKTNKKNGFIEQMTVSSKLTGVTIMTQMKDVEIPTTIISTTTYKTNNHVQ